MKYEDLKEGEICRLQFKERNEKNTGYVWITKIGKEFGKHEESICTYNNENFLEDSYFSKKPDFSSSLKDENFEILEANETDKLWLMECFNKKSKNDAKVWSIREEILNRDRVIENYEIF